jgi:hypothetical protein
VNSQHLIAELARFPATLRALLDGLSDDEIRFRPAAGTWSILEIVTHLADEEVEDFRARLFRTLEDPNEPWDPIAPEQWVEERRYADGKLDEVLDRFCTERASSLEALDALEDPDWNAMHEHPVIGPLRAGDLLVSWVVHDKLHHHQLVTRLHEIVLRVGGGFSSRYAEP